MSIAADQHELTVNGAPHSVAAGTALPNLLRTLGIDPDTARGVAVAINDEVIRRQAWSEAALHTGDRIEIVTAKQGG